MIAPLQDRAMPGVPPGPNPSGTQAQVRSEVGVGVSGRARPKDSLSGLVDSHGRVLRDLRVSVTDRCNFGCLYCLPETEAAQNFYRGRWATMPNPAPISQQWVPRSTILSFEEIERVVRIAVGLGIEKIRLTGGEPLLRRGLHELVARLAVIKGIADL